MKTTFYRVDERALRYLERYNALRKNQWVPVVVPCRGRVPCDHLALEVCEWFDNHGYKRITIDEPPYEDDPSAVGDDSDLDDGAGSDPEP